VIAFARGENLVTAVPRHSLMLAGDWRETSLALPSGSWTNRLTDDRFEGGNTPIGSLLGKFPVALLTRDQA
jgi:(1->4)-alpha-D-glucan 1-alpha-D-glucosylmutase